ncbi:MAG: tetraacyldisaccharide 4'-kinase [Proteobacteria bacterium]|nr:tetraacyldisaccharide 4'-kinase [Pseudomonadota bacterium]
MRRWLERVWYQGAAGGWLLAPLGWLFGAITAARRVLYRRGWLASAHPGRPVVVVGNLTVGGSGKTPFTAWLATALTARGLQVGIVSRGHGGSATGPLEVGAGSDPATVGDEPLLLARRCPATVVVGRDRLAAARQLAPRVDVILADDGLQHYRLRRDLEFLVIDGRRRFGNGRLLPAGPLREPASRARLAALRILNGGVPAAGELPMRLAVGAVVALADGTRRPLADFAGQRLHAVAGIGDPARFFATLRAAGVQPIEHPLPDHARLRPADVAFGDGLPVLMTEKDAVKCQGFPADGLHYLEVEADFAADDANAILERVLRLVGRT